MTTISNCEAQDSSMPLVKHNKSMKLTQPTRQQRRNSAGERFRAFAVGLFFFAAAAAFAVPVTFQVDMEYQITNAFPTFVPANDAVEVRGSFNDWSDGVALANVPGTSLYTNTYDVINSSPGSTVQYKFHTYGDNDVWDNYPGYIYTNDGNRAFVLSSSPQTLPPVYFGDQWGGSVTLTLQVDMGPQMFGGNFVPGSDTVEARGSWDGWSSGIALTNDPASSSPNIYSMTFPISSPAPGGLCAYKFHTYGIHDRYENDPNRLLLVTNPATIQPVVYFFNLATNDLLPADTLVTFQVSMTNAASWAGYSPPIAFNKTMQVDINSDWFHWWDWNLPPPAQYVLTNGPSGDWIYSVTLLIPKGSPVALIYKYGIDDGVNNRDNEAPFKVNHLRYVRAVGNYVMPLDTFGAMEEEISFGNLSVGPASAGSVAVSWLGRPGVHLQTATDLSSGLWLDLLATDGLSSTNYPVDAGSTFFRLVKN
jgi:hypothetical protein